MKHPNREQWVSFLYEECKPAEKSELTEHLKSCAACREQLETWRQTTKALNEYAVIESSTSIGRRPGLRSAWVQWAGAAALFLAIGITLGFALQSNANPLPAQQLAELRNRIEQSEAQNAKTQKRLVDLTQSIAENRAQDQAALLAVAQEVKATRKDFETVAVL